MIKNQGVTVIELLVVVTIVGVLATLVLGSIKPWTQIAKARDVRRISDLKLIAQALESYAGDSPCYPPEGAVNDCGGDGLVPYLNKIPCDPLTDRSYYYLRPDNCKTYSLYAYLEDDEGLNDYGVGNYAITSGNLTVPPVFIPTPTNTIPVPTITPKPTNTIPVPTITPKPTNTIAVPTPTFTPTATPTPTSAYPSCSVTNYACNNSVCVKVIQCYVECVPRYATSDCNNQCQFAANAYPCSTKHLRNK